MTARIVPQPQSEVSNAVLGKTVRAMFYKSPETMPPMLDSILFTDGTWLLFNRGDDLQGHPVVPIVDETNAKKLEPSLDTQRLDFLQSQTTGYGTGWMARPSTTGRGYRLTETSRPDALPDVREAIDAARMPVLESDTEEKTGCDGSAMDEATEERERARFSARARAKARNHDDL